jgi:NIMA (never in mitosis gene a)-related kinase
MVLGLGSLHKQQIIHRDIKCANVFLTKEGMVKLGDLNVSKVAKAGIL